MPLAGKRWSRTWKLDGNHEMVVKETLRIAGFEREDKGVKRAPAVGDVISHFRTSQKLYGSMAKLILSVLISRLLNIGKRRKAAYNYW